MVGTNKVYSNAAGFDTSASDEIVIIYVKLLSLPLSRMKIFPF